MEKRRFSAKSFRARHKGLKFPWCELKNDYNTSKFDILCSRFSVLMARVVELVDTRDLKSLGLKSRAGSIPAPGTYLRSSLEELRSASQPNHNYCNQTRDSSPKLGLSAEDPKGASGSAKESPGY